MPKNVRPLSVKEIAAITRVGTTAVGGVPGLSVQVLQSGDRYFVYRYQIDGRRSMVSLGSLSEISLKVARERAAAYAELSQGDAVAAVEQFLKFCHVDFDMLFPTHVNDVRHHLEAKETVNGICSGPEGS